MAAGDINVPTLHWVDYLIFTLFLAISAGIGIFYGYQSKKNAKTETTKGFLTAGGDMHFLPVGLSMMASFLSAIFVLSIPAEIAAFGMTTVYMSVSYLAGFGLAAHVHLPIFYRLELTSGYEYLELRYNKTVRTAGAVTFSVMILIYLSVVLYTPALAVNQVTQMPMMVSILGVGAVCTFYTALGGMKATIWNDAFQMSILLICFVVILVLGSLEIGGLVHIFQRAETGGRLDTSFDPDPFLRSTFWTHTVGATFINLTLYASSQTVIQKFLSTRNVREGQKAVWVSGALNAVCMVMVFLLGIMMYTYYEYCDPVASGRANKQDQMVPLFVMEIMGNLHGLPGLFLATTFSAALSSVSGSINALATVFLEDFIRPVYRKVKGQEIVHGTLISRLLAVTFGILTMSMAFLTELFGSTVIQIAFSIFGMIGSPLMAILTLGMFVPFVNAWGALCGLVASLGITCWVGFGRIILEIPNDPLPVSTEGCYNITGPVTTELVPTSDTPERTWLKIYDLSYMYYSVLAMLVAVVVALPVSLATGRNKGRDLDPRLFFTFASEGPCCGGQEAAEAEKEESVESDPGPAAPSHIKEPVPDYPMVTLWVDTTSTKRRTAAGGVPNQGFTDPMHDLARTEPDLSYRF